MEVGSSIFRFFNTLERYMSVFKAQKRAGLARTLEKVAESDSDEGVVGKIHLSSRADG